MGPTFWRLVAISIVIAGGGGMTAVLLVVWGDGRTASWWAAGLVLAASMAALVVADFVVLRTTFRPLAQLGEALTSIHKGERPWPLSDEIDEPAARGLSLAVSEMLERIDDESRTYSSKIFESIEEERRRLGRELHDETSQTLAAALLSLDVALKGAASCEGPTREQIERARRLIHHCLAQLKLLVHDLRPTMLDDFGLVPALRRYVQSHLETDGLVVELDLEGGRGRLPERVETALYRIAQESLANAQKHSGATRVGLTLETKPGYAAMSITDNGQGFEPDDVLLDQEGRYGVGLLSIRERVELLHGEVHIVSSPGCGTRVYVLIPLEEAGS
jgi:two-component system sensor histidine kinase UhpB